VSENTQTEWRVAFFLPQDRDKSPLIQKCPNEQWAREWAEMEMRDYPHATVTVERREVTPWRIA
jgi:hypothetical protein